MAVWVCAQCGLEKDARCKPKKCPECDGAEFRKKEEAPAAASASQKAAAGSRKRS